MRPPPPMYSRVPQRRPPLTKARPAPLPVQAPQPEAEALPKKPAKATKTKPKKAPKKVSKKTPTKKRIKWSEDMTQKDLYRLAKKHGLPVTSRDPKAWIVKILSEATR